ncbi:MAG: response regulator [Anaerolineales bacterium]|nr:response regulator [Anaerolineales bacterium]
MPEKIIRILLVEDEEAHVALISRSFEEQTPPIELVVARTLREATHLLIKLAPDLIITDWFLPDGDGIELLTADQINANYPVIVMTSHGNEQVAVEAMKAGALDYVVKSEVTLLAMPRIVQRVLREWGYIVERRRAEDEARQRNRELTLLNRIIAASVSGLTEEILETACRELAPAFNAARVSAALFNAEKTEATIMAEFAGDGQPSRLHTTLPIAPHSIFQHLLIQKTPLAIDTQSNSPQALPLSPTQAAPLLILPLTRNNIIVGALILEVAPPRQFSSAEINLAWSVADQISVALARVQLDSEQRQLSAAIEQTAESIVITDVAGNIIYVNPAFERITGYSRAEAMGQNPRILKSGKHEDAYYQEMWATISTGGVWRGRIVNRRKDGSLYTEEETITPVRDENGVIVNYVGVKHDVTREQQLEEQYRQAQKMEAVGRLTAGIAHDFNNILTVINGFSALIKTEIPPDSSLHESLDKIIDSGGRAANLTRQLLAFSRKQHVEPKVLYLNMVVTEMSKMLHRIIGEDIALETKLVPDLWPVKIDPSQIDQVILNLVVNARDAMPQGGKLTIETANVNLDQSYTRQHADVAPGDYVMLAVSDNGIGMADDVKQHIFEPFFTTKEMGRGTGLGLATVFGIIKQSGGHIWVYSELNYGTIFKIYLPRLLRAGHQPEQVSPVRRLSGGGETILLVEDEPAVRELAVKVLRRQGYLVLEAANGKEALQLAQAHQGQIHLLLTDVIMPNMNGKTLAEAVTKLYPQTKILFSSGYTDNVMMQFDLMNSEVMFISKPFSPTTLTHKVRDALDRYPSKMLDS